MTTPDTDTLHRAGISQAMWDRYEPLLDDVLDGLQPLVEPVTWTVDATSGDDESGNGADVPFGTLQRALDERAKYGELRSELVIELVGAGPYTIEKSIVNSVCGEGGWFEIRGDVTARTVLATGTFTGPWVSGSRTVPIASGLGVGTYNGKFVRVTSGAVAGAEFMISRHTDTTCYPQSSAAFRGSEVVANGDTFEIFEPATEIVNAIGVTATGLCSGLRGGTVGSLTSSNAPTGKTSPTHYFRHVKIVGDSELNSSVVGFCTVVVSGDVRFNATDAQCGGYAYYDYGTGLPDGYLAGAGLNVTGSLTSYTAVQGGGSITVTGSVFHYTGKLTVVGCNLVKMHCYNASATHFYDGYAHCTLQSLQVSTGAPDVVSVCFLYIANTDDDCIRVSGNGSVQAALSLSGGTTLAGKYGIALSAAGRVLVSNISPALTGGTAGADLSVPGTAAVAYTTLNAAGTGLLSPTSGGSIFRA